MSEQPIVVVAVGGNALTRRGEPIEWARQRDRAADAARRLAPIAEGARLVITHGNGPQVGLLAEGADASGDTRPLDALDAETEGMIGYVLAQGLSNALGEREVAVLLTRVVVEADDPAFRRPAKFIGPGYDETAAQNLAASRGWSIAADGERWRRVVASPEPRAIIELRSIRVLLDAGVVVICAGGGGIPVVEREPGVHDGVEAVVDKDLAAALLATELGAASFVLLTDVDGVYEGWGSDHARAIRHTTTGALRSGAFAPGSMGPKVESACRFVEATGCSAVIGSLDDADAVARGDSGTVVRPDYPAANVPAGVTRSDAE